MESLRPVAVPEVMKLLLSSPLLSARSSVTINFVKLSACHELTCYSINYM
jgi:hypothetical protein